MALHPGESVRSRVTMAFHLLIDGYNLIRNFSPLAQVEARDFAQGRTALLEWLAEYRQRSPYPVTVVFDGREGPSPLEARDLYRGIKVVYSRAGETADEVIERMTGRERGKFLVVTSDRELARSCRSQGAEVIGSETFAHRVEAKLFSEKSSEEEEETPQRGKKKKGAPFRLSKKAKRERRLREKL